MYFYNVTAQESNTMNQLGVVGDCQLVLAPSFEIMCVLVPSQQVVAIWPLDCLRKFSYGNGLFSFEAGRQAPRGPGEYTFISQHDRLIHDRLSEFIDKAKRTSCSGSVSSVRLSSVIDYRPPAQLPVQTHDSSTDSQENSDSDEIAKKKGNPYSGPPKTTPPPEVQSPVRTITHPPLPECPPPKTLPPKIPPKSTLPNQDLVSNSNAEQKVNAVNRYLKSSVNSPDPTPELDSESSNHVYSHTIHSQPKGLNPQIYNSLVHEKAPNTKNFTRYEMAYPEGKTSVPVSGPANVVYDTAFNESDGHRNPPSLATIPSKPSVSVPQPAVDAGGMTANPLYGSQGNLLEDIMSKQVFETPQSESPPIPPKPKSLSASPESLPTAPVHLDITSNPVYVSSNIKGNLPATESPTESHQTPGTNGDQPSSNAPKYRSSLLNNSSAPLKENIPDDGSCINVRSYSIVNKHITESSPVESFIPGSMDSDPPPIPDRIGSFNED